TPAGFWTCRSACPIILCWLDSRRADQAPARAASVSTINALGDGPQRSAEPVADFVLYERDTADGTILQQPAREFGAAGPDKSGVEHDRLRRFNEIDRR